MATKVCPNCGWRKDISAEVCHCGYDFVSGKMGTPEAAPTEATPDNPQAVVMASSEEKAEIEDVAIETTTLARSKVKKYLLLWGLALSVAVMFYFWAEADTSSVGCWESCVGLIFLLTIGTMIITSIFAIYDFLSWLARRKGVREPPSPQLTDEEKELRRKRRMRY